MKPLLLIILVASTGCTRVVDEEKPRVTFEQDEAELCMVIVVDKSKGYERDMWRTGGAWKAITSLLRDFKKSRPEGKDRVILAQISSKTHQAPIWRGSARTFVSAFANPESFEKYLQDFADSSEHGARVYDSLCETIDYATLHSGTEFTGIFVFSNMKDTLSAPGGEDRFIASLAKFNGPKSGMGFYWVDYHEAIKLVKRFRESGLTGYVLEDGLTCEPRMPRVE